MNNGLMKTCTCRAYQIIKNREIDSRNTLYVINVNFKDLMSTHVVYVSDVALKSLRNILFMFHGFIFFDITKCKIIKYV